MPEVSFEDKRHFFMTLCKVTLFFNQNPQLISLMQDMFTTNHLMAQQVTAEFDRYVEELMSFINSYSSIDILTPSRVRADPDRIYIDGCWDIMHSGHFNAIRQAKMLGKVLVVGVHNDEEIMRNKGMPVMTNQERLSMVRACKWADEVVENAPYSATEEWLDSLNCRYIAHGDDIALNQEGVDAYSQLKTAGRFKIIKRTEGISTTMIVGKLLLMTMENKASVSEPFTATDINHKSNFITTTRRISEFANRTRRPEGKIVYVDGSFDLFHIGHVETLKKAKELGDFLIVGVHDDLTVNQHKGSNYPIMNLYERVLNVLAVKYVDEVVIAAPWNVTEDLLKSLNIQLVVQGSISKLDVEHSIRRKQSLEYNDQEEDPYLLPKALGIYQEVQSESELETQHIIQRIIENRLKVLNKYQKSSKKEQNYYESSKTYVEEL
ncbi:unnamed protein product [Blepharisma stoltei]|uniref:ethanolamine-phosphate cytidylyltransferase n=1 Tax=Blepharisma stoltei TaxID=1481888 RepID=A0AAU9K7D5_9CILI|nr:unnamed protein product [Blepharisma stoltei]